MSDDFKYDLEEKLSAMRDIRTRAGWTQQQMADHLGLSRVRISQLEAGEWQTSEHMRTLIQLSRLLDHLQLSSQPDPEESSSAGTPPAGD